MLLYVFKYTKNWIWPNLLYENKNLFIYFSLLLNTFWTINYYDSLYLYLLFLIKIIWTFYQKVIIFIVNIIHAWLSEIL